MTEQERIEGINSEQLATATDRVLLASRFGRARPSSTQLYARAHGTYGFYTPQTDAPLYAPQGETPRYTPQTPARGSSPEIFAPQLAHGTPPHGSHYVAARGSSPQIHVGAISRRDEQTVFTRLPKHKHARAAWRRFTTIALVTSLVSVATAIALLL